MYQLDKYRKQIDKIDSQIIGLLRKRFDIVKNKILPYKKSHKIKYLQKSRFNEIKQNLLKKSDLLISKKFIQTLLDLIHQHSLKLQK